MAVRLEEGFGVDAGFWLDLQKKYDIWKVKASKRVKVQRFIQPALD
jgi:plasmid maintenance system antidote protein VapI